MEQADFRSVVQEAVAHGLRYLESLPERPIGPTVDPDQILERLGGPLPEDGEEAVKVVRDIAAKIGDDALNAMASGRFYGYVIGGGVPAAVGADVLTVLWDQNAGMYNSTPGVSAAEQVACDWLKDLLHLPGHASIGIVTGGQMANFTCLAAARGRTLRALGWAVEDDGLFGAPPIRVIVGEEWHSTVGKALRMLGIGSGRVEVVPADDRGRMDVDELRRVLVDGGGSAHPTIVCAQAGDIHAGGFDRFGPIVDVLDDVFADHRDRAWLHVDGAIGLWAAAATDPAVRALTDGMDRADSWSADAHKLLNTTFDIGVAIVAHPADHQRALAIGADYLPAVAATHRDAIVWNPEMSRRARGLVLYATLRSLGRSGVAALVDKNCRLAGAIADGLTAQDGISLLHPCQFTQLSFRLQAGAEPDQSADDAHTRAVAAAVHAEGVCFPTPSVWKGQAVLRVSVTNWSTDDDDVAQTVASIAGAHRRLRSV